jgi:cobalt-zinc-cadmium efflux system membrane fusion protein
MKLNRNYFLALVCMALVATAHGHTVVPSSRMIILDEAAVHNLRIQTAVAEDKPFAETLFALGRIEAIPAMTARVSSRIAGRLIELNIAEGDEVQANQTVARIESRQPGNNPPLIDITSPLSGLVTRSDYRKGDPVVPDAAIAEIMDLSEVYAVARVPESDVARLHVGARAQIRIQALGDREYVGELLRFGVEANRAGGTMDAIFRLKNPDGKIRPGMRAEFQIVLDEREGSLSLPKGAVQGPPSARHVYVREPSIPNAFVKVPVKVGKSNQDRVEIIEGICGEDEVVIQGAYTLGFVSGGSVSLKEALDAAHGHAHNEDGSEIGDDDHAEDSHEDHGHSHDHEHGGITLREKLLMVTTGLLAVLLAISTIWRRSDRNTSQK